LTPFALGAAIGAIATNRVPVGNAAGHLFSSWLNPTSILIGVVAVSACAYLAAVYLAADAARRGERELEDEFRVRALGTGVVAGALALAGVAVLRSDAHRLYHELVAGEAVPALVVSILAGAGTLVLVWQRRFEAARYSAALAVAAIVAGWALGQWPTILPGLSVSQAAAPHDALVAVVVAVLAGGAILFPSLALLLRLALTGRLQGPAAGAPAPAIGRAGLARTSLLARVAVACLIIGFGLLNVADARWAHAVGVASLVAFIVSAFLAIIPATLGRDELG
jgi:cytochrome bd ubiquinol oxidase subunit II